MTSPDGEKMHESYRRAIQLARNELNKRPYDANIRSSLALYLVRDGQPKEALAEIEPVLSQANLRGSVLFKGHWSWSWRVTVGGPYASLARRSTPAISSAKSPPNPTWSSCAAIPNTTGWSHATKSRYGNTVRECPEHGPGEAWMSRLE